MKLDTLVRHVTAYFRKNAARLGMNPETVEARYILNWGGFVNASFFIQDGRKIFHLKLAGDEESQYRLARWLELRRHLSAHYHAPRIFGWVKIPRTPFAGLLSQYIPGKPVDFAAQPEVLNGLLDLLPRLHGDRVLAETLQTELELEMEGGAPPADDASLSAGVPLANSAPLSAGVPAPTCADYFLSVYIDRFDEDLLGVIADLPPFVPLDLYDWMMSETRELEGLARDLPEFQHPAVSPTHGDLWPSNVLVANSGEWFIIDWDDLNLGDPALEYSILLGPLWRAGKLSAEQAAGLLPPGDPAMRDRFMLCLRALLLDEVIDPLADWVEARFAPQHMEEVRAAKERTHREALEKYRELFPA